MSTELAYLAGGGLHNQALLSMFDPSSGGHLALDPSSIAGFVNGQTIYLPDNLRNRFMTGLLNTISVNNVPVVPEPKTQFQFRNEDFTALGNIGHLVRVPEGGRQTMEPSQAANNPEMNALSGAKVTINGNPIEIIGVADMSQLDQSGNPHFFSFNPGTGSAAEIQALQSALLGTAVDMSNFTPPPYMDVGQISSTVLDPSSVVMTKTLPTVDTVNSQTPNNNHVASNSASVASSSIDSQLEQLLSQGHSQANSRSDINAIMGQIDSAINDINRRANITTVGSVTNIGLDSLASGLNFGIASPEPTNTQTEFTYSGTAQTASNPLISNSGINTASIGLVAEANSNHEMGSGHFPGALSNMQVDSTLHGNVQSGRDTILGNTKYSVASTSEPIANGINNGGMFPMGGNMASRYAAISDIAQRLTKLDGRLGGVSTKDIRKTDITRTGGSRVSVPSASSKSGGITFTNVPGTSASDGGTGIFAVSRSLEEMLKSQNAMRSLSSDVGIESLSVPVSLDSFAQTGNINNIDSVSLLGRNSVLGKINRPDTSSIRIANTNIDNIVNSQNSIDTRNVLNTGMGSISNIINASSNKLSTNSRITNNGIPANITDAVSGPLTGSNGGPITNMVGIQGQATTGVSSQLLSTLDQTVLSSLDNGASTSLGNTLSTSLDNTMSTSLDKTAIPSFFNSVASSKNNTVSSSMKTDTPRTGSFVVGAGQPNPTVIRTGNAAPEKAGSFSVASRPGTIGTFSVGTDTSFQSNAISNTPDIGINAVDLASEMGPDTNHTVIHTVETVEITSVESSSSANQTSSTASSSSAVQSLGGMGTSLNAIETRQFDPLPDMAGGFAVGGGGGNMNFFNRMSLPNAKFQTKKNTVATVHNEILTGRKPVDTRVYGPATVDQPRASPLVMNPAAPEASAATVEIKPAVSSPAPDNTAILSSQTAILAPKPSVLNARPAISNSQRAILPPRPPSLTSQAPILASEPRISSPGSARFSIGSGFSVAPNLDNPGLPAGVTNNTQIINATITERKPPETRAAALPSQWSASGSNDVGFAVGQHSKPIVGNIFGSVGESSSQKLTQRFLEKSGITKRPAMDFMTTFLNTDSKPKINGQDLNIVPLRSDNTMRRSPTNMFVVGTGARKSEPLVDKFGIADIATRSKQLNSNQWSNFVGSKTPEAGIQTKYQTQNIIGASETRPLNGNGQTSITTDFGAQGPSSSVSNKGSGASAQTSSVKAKRSNFVFEAPGMSGRSAVSVSSFNPRKPAKPSRTITNQRRTVDVKVTSANNVPLDSTVGVADLQRSPPLSEAQTTAIKTSEFANNFKRTLKSSGVPATRPNVATIKQNGIIDATNTMLSTNQGADLGGLDTLTAQDVLEAARNSLTMIDPIMPLDTAGGPGFDGPISTTNIERMNFGKPIVLNKAANTTMSQTSGNMITTQDASGMLLNQNMDIAATRRGTLTPVSNTPVIDTPGGPPVQATRFTSGNRFAVFGPANDATGRSFRAKATSRQGTGMRIGVLAPVAECRYQPDPSSRYYFIYKNGVTQYRFRCALGTAFDEMTCECSIRVNDHGKFYHHFPHLTTKIPNTVH